MSVTKLAFLPTNCARSYNSHLFSFDSMLNTSPKVKVLVDQSSGLFITPWTIAYQAPLSMGCSRQEHWSGLPFPPPGVLPEPGIEPGYPALQADSLHSEPPGKPYIYILYTSAVSY